MFGIQFIQIPTNPNKNISLMLISYAPSSITYDSVSICGEIKCKTY